MTSGTQFRPDIQGRRALSVILVLVYHVFPAAVPGGYVGVDVFFVISGFLITNILLKQAESDGRITFLAFYMRRLRRLAPAATVTLAVMGVASLVVLPELYWRETAFEILAATFYVENFFLFSRSIDYLAEDSAPTLFQHYWSLSIEEQFYIVWPALIALTILACRAAGLTFRLGMTVLAGGVFASSLTASILLTAETDGAYFLTHLRAWELALGGLLAAVLPWVALPAIVRAVMGWGGAAMVVAAGFLFGAGTVFPGYAALLPVMGAALLLAAGGQTSMAGLGWILSNPVARFIGDRSYSIYLVHWPLVIFALALNGGQMSWWVGLLVMALSVGLADLSFRFVENPFRNAPAPAAASGLAGAPGPAAAAGLPADRPRRVSFSGPLVLPAWTFSMSLVAAGALFVAPMVKTGQTARVEIDAYPGARVLLYPDQVRAQEDVTPVPPLERARNDNAAVYRDRCHVSTGARRINPCVYGVENGVRTIYLAGDSTAAQWLPALEVVAERQGWRIVSHSKSSCGLMASAVRRGNRTYDECAEWNAQLEAELLEVRPDLVITTMSPRFEIVGANDEDARLQGYTDGLTQVWDRLAAAGVPVAVIRPTPAFARNVLNCLASNVDDPALCGRSRGQVLPESDAVTRAVPRASRAYLLDLNDGICSADRCEVVVGNVIVYRDRHHLTASYVRTLADELERQLRVIDAQDMARFGRDNPLFDPALVQ